VSVSADAVTSVVWITVRTMSPLTRPKPPVPGDAASAVASNMAMTQVVAEHTESDRTNCSSRDKENNDQRYQTTAVTATYELTSVECRRVRRRL